MTKRQESEAWLTQWAEARGGTLEKLLDALADFSMNEAEPDVFEFKGTVVHEDYDPTDEVPGKSYITGNDAVAFWVHYKTLTGVSPWDKQCRGCN